MGQYREMGVLIWRNASLDMLMGQCLSAETDAGKGRQMPVVCPKSASVTRPATIKPAYGRPALWFPQATLPHNIITVSNPDTSSGRRRLRTQTSRTRAERARQRCDVLLRRGCCV